MRANDMQVGGGHYKDREFQHWDVIDRNGIGYLEGVATKYVCRYKDKNGLQDLKKAEHYLMKLLEEVDDHNRRPRGVVPMDQIIGLSKGHDLGPVAAGAVQLILTWSSRIHLSEALEDVRFLIADEEERASPAS